MREMTDGREVGRFVDDRRIEGHPGMLVEPAADHFSVFGPLIVCVERGVNSNEALTVVFDERHHVFLLIVVEVEFTRGTDEDDCVEEIEVLGDRKSTRLNSSHT